MLGGADYDYDDFDFVSDGLLRTRLGAGGNGNLCRRGEVLRCLAGRGGSGGGGGGIVTRGGFGAGGNNNNNNNRGSSDNSAVNFG